MSPHSRPSDAKPDRPFDIAIAGASFAGLTLARALSQALGGEVRIALLDRTLPASSGVPADDPRASAISATSRRLLEAIGAWALVADEAQPVCAVEITDSGLEAGIRPVLLTYATELDADGGETSMHILPNHRLMAALLQLTSCDPAIVRLPVAEVLDYTAGDAVARAVLSDGSQVDAALLVAADGRRSRLREAAGIGTVGWSYSQKGIVTIVAHDRPHQARAVQHFLPAGPFAILPLTGNRSCITWTESSDRAEAIVALDDACFLAELDLRFGGKLGTLGLAGPRRTWPLDVHLARAYVAPRLALLGDAAHGVHPIAGQGLNLALRDVAALAECIADGVRLGLDYADATILERYERWRRFDSALSAAAFDGLNRIFSNDVRLFRSAREAGLGLVDRVPMLKRWLVAEAAGVNGDLPRLLRGLAA
jgi:2-octaprenyl-6-methoxyphenol hydroxylase